MKFTVLPLLALAGSTVAMPAGQPQAAPPGIVDPTILRRTAGKNATHPAKNATVKAQPVFRIQNLDYTLEPLSKKSLQSNLTFDVAYGAKASEASAFTTCTLSWSVRNKKKEYKSAKYVSCNNNIGAKVESKPYGKTEVSLLYSGKASNATKKVNYVGEFQFKDVNKAGAKAKVSCAATTFEDDVKGRECTQIASASAWDVKASKKTVKAGKKNIVARLAELF
ncbi:hypothetical protein C1H76_3066 [Elsinoe australis]|uniref:Uncharacterized protein n=1 Tax=Elsinoe australis TaxID=40998 RepID=A0A4U7B148_9PEZI|nr:hypothetical protein C1H76_3066 [Elsinoe australis]